MTEPNQAKLEVLKLIAEENFAHARDHEMLRAQVTSTLVAAAFVAIGLAIDKNVTGQVLTFVGVGAIVIGLLNVIVVAVHNNRFDRHVSIARIARGQIDSVEVDTNIPKLLNLSYLWMLVACLPIFAGIGLLLVKYPVSA